VADGTKIEWTDATWNPVRGCSRVSEGCRNCYAEGVAARFSGPWQAYEGLAKMTPQGPRWTGKVSLVGNHIADPLRWDKPRRIFVNSMSDLFHSELSNENIALIFAVMACAPKHTFQCLTKRPERMREFMAWLGEEPWKTMHRALAVSGVAFPPWVGENGEVLFDRLNNASWPLPNVWLGTSVENQRAADERVPYLLQTPAVVRFLSCEPLLGPVNLEPWICEPFRCRTCGSWKIGYDPNPKNLPPHDPDRPVCAFGCVMTGEPGTERCRDCNSVNVENLRGLDWVIVGGESGHGARPMHPAWARSLRDQCTEAGVPLFFKQWGEWGPRSRDDGKPFDSDRNRRDKLVSTSGTIFSFKETAGEGYAPMSFMGKEAAGRLLDGRTWDEFPKAVSP
jgi:protein gp37